MRTCHNNFHSRRINGHFHTDSLLKVTYTINYISLRRCLRFSLGTFLELFYYYFMAL